MAKFKRQSKSVRKAEIQEAAKKVFLEKGFRYTTMEDVVKNTTLSEVITDACMAKLFDEVPEKKLYLMFLAEIPYDRDYEALYFQLEKQSFELFIKTLHYPPQQELEIMNIIRHQEYFLLKIFHGMLVMHELFSDKDVFNQNKEKIRTIILTAIQNFFNRHQNLLNR